MKTTEPVSAFAVYQKILPQKRTDSTNKAKKLKSKHAKKLVRKKVLLGIENSDIPVKTEKSSLTTKKESSSSKCKQKSTRRDKESPERKKKRKRGKTPANSDNDTTLQASCGENGSIRKDESRIIDNMSIIENETMITTLNDNETTREDEGRQQYNNPIQDGLKLFQWMISPLNHKTFFKTHWEQEPLYIERKNTKYYSHLLTSTSLDSMVRDNNLYYTRNIDVVSYQNEEKEVINPEGKATASALWDYYHNGCSIRVLNPQSYNKKVHLLLATLQEYFGSMVGANVYLTPPGSQGFAPHYDDIEAFVLQIEGRKHWKLYYPKDEDMLTRYSSKNFKHDELGEPFLEVTLEAGSLLYFPRGIIHEGRTDPDSHSLHITVSVYQNNAYVDLLEKAIPHALMKAANSDIEFRKGLPLHFLRSKRAKKLMKKQVITLIDKLKEYLEVEDGLEELGRKLVYDSMPPVLSSQEMTSSSRQGGELLDNGVVYNRLEFDPTTEVRLTRYHCIQLVQKEGQNKLYYSTENSKFFHGEEENWLELEEPMVPVITCLKEAFPGFVKIDDLPLDDVEVKVQLVNDLWEKGILIFGL